MKLEKKDYCAQKAKKCLLLLLLSIDSVFGVFITLFKLCKNLTHAPCLTLCDPMECSLPGVSVHGNGLPFISPGDLPNPGIEPADSILTEPPGKPTA